MRCSRLGGPPRAFDVAAVFFVDLEHLRPGRASGASNLESITSALQALLFGRLSSPSTNQVKRR